MTQQSQGTVAQTNPRGRRTVLALGVGLSLAIATIGAAGWAFLRQERVRPIPGLLTKSNGDGSDRTSPDEEIVVTKNAISFAGPLAAWESLDLSERVRPRGDDPDTEVTVAGVTKRFDREGRLFKVAKQNGDEVDLFWDQQGRIVQLFARAGGKTCLWRTEYK